MSKITTELKRETLLLYKHILRAHLDYLKKDLRVFGILSLIQAIFLLKRNFSFTIKILIKSKCEFFQRSIIILLRWKIYYDILIKEKNLKNINPNPVLYQKLDLDQMKTLNEIKEVIEKKQLFDIIRIRNFISLNNLIK